MHKTLQTLAVSCLFSTVVGCGTIPQKGAVADLTPPPEPTPAPITARQMIIPTSTAETDAEGRYINAGRLFVIGDKPGEKAEPVYYTYRRENPALGMPDAALLVLGHYGHYNGQRDVILEGIVIDRHTLTLVDEYNCTAPAGSKAANAASEAFRRQVPDFNAPPPVVVLPETDLNRLCSHGKTDLVTDKDRKKAPRTAGTAHP